MFNLKVNVLLYNDYYLLATATGWMLMFVLSTLIFTTNKITVDCRILCVPGYFSDINVISNVCNNCAIMSFLCIIYIYFYSFYSFIHIIYVILYIKHFVRKL